MKKECAICSGEGTLEERLRKVREWEAQCLEKYGWYSHCIPSEDPNTPTGYDYHTHGLSPDLQIVMPLPQELAHSIATSVADRIKNGEKLEHGQVLGKVIKNFNVRLARVKDSARPILRIILPDKSGHVMPYDMEEPYEQQYKGAERL